MKTAIIIRRIGPYHAARLRALAAAGRGPVGVVEIVEADDTYAWDPVTQIEGVERATLFRSEAEAHSISALSSRMFETLERWMPAIVAVPGWADPAALAALAWSRSARRSAIIMSDSTAWDARRVPWREVVKRAVVGMADAALVAGEPHRRYLMALGMPSDRIEIGYDVIDNHHFAAGADCARADAAASRRRLGLPNQYILCVARFVEKKNLLGLLDAYEDYLTIATAAASELVLVGSGPLNHVLQRRAAEGILAGRVTIRPFAQYNELPSLYGLAQALILPSIVDQWGLVINEAMASGIPVLASNRCGAAEDLVLEEATGRLFDPHSRRQITQAMLWMTSKTGREVKALGTKARNHIAAWSPDCFADSFHRAATSALQRRPSRWTDAAVLKMLARMVRDPMAQRAPQSS